MDVTLKLDPVTRRMLRAAFDEHPPLLAAFCGALSDAFYDHGGLPRERTVDKPTRTGYT